MNYKEAIEHAKEQLEIFGGEHKEFIELAIEALQIADRLEQAEKREIQPDMNERARAYVMGYNQALADLRGGTE